MYNKSSGIMMGRYKWPHLVPLSTTKRPSELHESELNKCTENWWLVWIVGNDWSWYGDFYNLFTIFARLMFSDKHFLSIFYEVIWDLLNDDDSLHFFVPLRLRLSFRPIAWHEQTKADEKREQITRQSLWSDVIIRKKDDSSNFCGKIVLDCLTIEMTCRKRSLGELFDRCYLF